MGWAQRARYALDLARAHKGRVIALAVVVMGLVARFVPEFPSDDVISVVKVLLGA